MEHDQKQVELDDDVEVLYVKTTNSGKKRILTHDALLSKPGSDFLIYKSSDINKEVADLIVEHKTDFITLASGYGLSLIIACHSTQTIVYCGFDSSSKTREDVDNAFKKMDDLVEMKKSMKTESKISLQEVSNLIDVRVQEALSQQLASVRHLQEQLDRKEEMIQILNKQMRRILRNETDMDEDSFFHQSNFELIRDNNHCLDVVCGRLHCYDGPFVGPSLRADRKELKAYLDLLQRDYVDREEEERGVTAMQMMISLWCDDHLCEQIPSRTRIEQLRDEYKAKFDLDHDIIGTIHFVKIPSHVESNFVLFLIIVDKYIVFAERIVEGQDLTDYHEEFSTRLLWRTFRFAIDRPFVNSDQMYMFKEVNNEELYKENGKVVTFIKNNFKCIQAFHNRSIPTMYNLFYDCY